MSRTRASRGASAEVTMTPVAATVTPPGTGYTRPQPVPTSPGSTPSTRKPAPTSGSRDGLQDLVGDVEVGVDVLDVVQVLQRLDQAHDRRGLRALDAHGRLRHVRHLGLDDGHARLLQRVAHGVHFS